MDGFTSHFTREYRFLAHCQTELIDTDLAAIGPKRFGQQHFIRLLRLWNYQMGNTHALTRRMSPGRDAHQRIGFINFTISALGK